MNTINEPLADGMTRHWQVDEVLVDTKTDFQHLVIARTAQGVSLFCDNDRQSTEFSQLTYHEALMVPALLLADNVERVLVIGSSEGVVCQMAVQHGAIRRRPHRHRRAGRPPVRGAPSVRLHARGAGSRGEG